MHLYTGPKGVRFVPIFGKSGDFWGEIVEVRKKWIGAARESGVVESRAVEKTPALRERVEQ
jgi:hypothetical protein